MGPQIVKWFRMASSPEPAAWFDLELPDDRLKGDAPDSEIDVCMLVK